MRKKKLVRLYYFTLSTAYIILPRQLLSSQHLLIYHSEKINQSVLKIRHTVFSFITHTGPFLAQYTCVKKINIHTPKRNRPRLGYWGPSADRRWLAPALLPLRQSFRMSSMIRSPLDLLKKGRIRILINKIINKPIKQMTRSMTCLHAGSITQHIVHKANLLATKQTGQ